MFGPILSVSLFFTIMGLAMGLYYIVSSSYVFYSLKLTKMYECGFKVKLSSRFPFSVRFIFLLILFVLFDMEMVFLVGIPFLLSKSVLLGFFLYAFFLLLLLLSMLEEWRRGMLTWI